MPPKPKKRAKAAKGKSTATATISKLVVKPKTNLLESEDVIQIQDGLRSAEVAERLKNVCLLGDNYKSPEIGVIDVDSSLWKAFLSRFTDINPKVRAKCVDYAPDIARFHTEVQPNIVEALSQRFLDSDENVRLETLKSILPILQIQPSLLITNKDLLKHLQDRVRDKKAPVRREALLNLSFLYRKHLPGIESFPIPERIAAEIKNNILHAYYQPSIDDRIFIEHLLCTNLVPNRCEPLDRMLALLYAFVTMDDDSVKVFTETQKVKVMHRRRMAELIQCLKSHTGNDLDNKLSQKLKQVSSQFPEPAKFNKHLYKFCTDLKRNKNNMKEIEAILNPESDCEENERAGNSLLNNLGCPVKSPYNTNMKMMLERSVSMLIDKKAVLMLLNIITRVGRGSENVLKKGIGTELPADVVVERGAHLVSILAFLYGVQFCDEEILGILAELLKYNNEKVVLYTLEALKFVGMANRPPLVDDFPTIFQGIIKTCHQAIKSPNPKIGKAGFRCLHANLSHDKIDVLKIIIGRLRKNLHVSNPSCRTAIVVLGFLAEAISEEFKDELKDCITKQIIKDIIMHPQRCEADVQEDGPAWCEREELPVITQCVISALKCVTRWIIGIKNYEQGGQEVFKMLFSVLRTSGTFGRANELFPLSEAEKSWLRLTAGCCLLKLYRYKEFDDGLTVMNVSELSCLMTDDVPEVRSRFAAKLHKGLSYKVPYGCLAMDFLGFYALGGFEEDTKLRQDLQRYLKSDITKRRDYITALISSTTPDDPKVAIALHAALPDYVLLYAIPILTHHPKFKNYRDVDELRTIELCLWFIMEPLITKNEFYSYGFYKTMLDRVKNKTTGTDNEELDNKMYTICDLASGLLLSMGNTFEMKLPMGHGPAIPLLYYKPHKDPRWTNTRLYLPPNMKPLTPARMRAGARKEHVSSGTGGGHSQHSQETDKTPSTTRSLKKIVAEYSEEQEIPPGSPPKPTRVRIRKKIVVPDNSEELEAEAERGSPILTRKKINFSGSSQETKSEQGSPLLTQIRKKIASGSGSFKEPVAPRGRLSPLLTRSRKKIVPDTPEEREKPEIQPKSSPLSTQRRKRAVAEILEEPEESEDSPLRPLPSSRPRVQIFRDKAAAAASSSENEQENLPSTSSGVGNVRSGRRQVPVYVDPLVTPNTSNLVEKTKKKKSTRVFVPIREFLDESDFEFESEESDDDNGTPATGRGSGQGVGQEESGGTGSAAHFTDEN